MANMSGMLYQNITPTYFKDDYNKDYSETSTNINKNDPRPQFGNNNNIVTDIKNKESIDMITKTSKNSPLKLKNNSTILDESFNSISGNMIDKVSSFSSDFNSELVSVKYEYDMNNTNDDDYTFGDLLTIHILAFVRYMDNGPSIAYIGVFLVFISFLIYILNILLKK